MLVKRATDVSFDIPLNYQSSKRVCDMFFFCNINIQSETGPADAECLLLEK